MKTLRSLTSDHNKMIVMRFLLYILTSCYYIFLAKIFGQLS